MVVALIASGDDQSLAHFVLVAGWVTSVMSLVLLVLFTALYSGMAAAFLDIVEGGAGTRVLGMIGVGFGGAFVALGISAL